MKVKTIIDEMDALKKAASNTEISWEYVKFPSVYGGFESHAVVVMPYDTYLTMLTAVKDRIAYLENLEVEDV